MVRGWLRKVQGRGPVPVLFVFLLLGCEDSSYQVSLLSYDQEQDSYRIGTETLETIDDIDRLAGEATTLYGGAELTLDQRDGYLRWQEGGASVAFAALKRDGVYYPEDYDSLAMVSIYYNMELSLLFFEEIGLPHGALVHLPTYYWPLFYEIDTMGEKTKLTDNAFYMYMTDKERAFFILPFDRFQWVPMAMNSGIITHEYTHAVYDALIYDQARQALVLATPATTNFLYALNEGCADFMAAARTGDPDFLQHTVPKMTYTIQCNSSAALELVRNVAQIALYSKDMDDDARTFAPAAFCPYEIGTFVASLFYGITREIDPVGPDEQGIPSAQARYLIAAHLLATLDQAGRELDGDFELWELFDLFVRRFDSAADQETACAVLFYRYNYYFSEVSACQD